MSQEHHSPRQIPFVTISLKENFRENEEQRKLLFATMDQIFSTVIVGEPKKVEDYLNTLYGICMDPVEVRETMYQMGESHQQQTNSKESIVYDTNMLLLMKEGSNLLNPSSEDIIGFMSYGLQNREKVIHLSQCSVAPEHRKNNTFVKAMLYGLVTLYGAHYRVIKLESPPEKMALYLACGFTFGNSRAMNKANEEIFAKYKVDGPPGYFINNDGTINLFYCFNDHCRFCQKRKEKEKVTLSFCSICHDVPYCSVECQREDWKKHRKECSPNAIIVKK